MDVKQLTNEQLIETYEYMLSNRDVMIQQLILSDFEANEKPPPVSYADIVAASIKVVERELDHRNLDRQQ